MLYRGRSIQILPGQYLDKETGLFYNYFRDYDPQTGRYVQSDPIGLLAGLNPYLYVDANPISWFDALGLAPKPGHHVFPRHIWKDLGLPPEAFKAFNEAVIGPLSAPGETPHNMGGGHGDYNKAVKELWDQYLKEKNIDPRKMTQQQAEDFLQRVRQCPDPRVRDFNQRQFGRHLNYYIRRWFPRGSE